MAWRVVALSADLQCGMVMPCCLDGVDLAIWRSTAGQVAVWGDRCPHRGMRLSQGFVRGEALSCIYHGWQYGSDGGCVSIPAHPDLVPPKSICATTYAAQERHGFIWAALAETSDTPPNVPSQTPVRSLQIDAPISAVAAHFGAPDQALIHVTRPVPVTLALQPVNASATALHTQTTDPSARQGVSDWLEQQRIVLEREAA